MSKYSTIEDALNALRAGKIIVVSDDEDRENEGDFICAAQFATPENINFMATHGKGLICMPINEAIARKFNLGPMQQDNTDAHQTAFTVSIDHIDTGTGISAFARSRTALEILNPKSTAADFRRPGHLFPLLAKNKGVLERPGHTEATVDLMRLAGLEPAGLCCEILADDGQMMLTPELHQLAQKFNLHYITIKQLQAYRKKNEVLVEALDPVQFPTKHGKFKLHPFIDTITGEHHLAIVKGDIAGQSDVLCRVHSECLTGDCFGSERCDCGAQLAHAMDKIEAAGKGVILYMRQEGRGIGLVNKLRAYYLQEQGMDTVDANRALGFRDDEREYHISAQMLRQLQVASIKLLTNNPHKIEELTQWGTVISERVPVKVIHGVHAELYMQTKKERMRHLL